MEDRRVGGADVSRRAVEVPRAALSWGKGRVWFEWRLGSPVAVFDGNGTASLQDILVESDQICLSAAAVELPRVEVVLAEGLHVGLDLLVALGGIAAVIGADAVVAIPARGEPKRVGMGGHGVEVGEAIMVDDWVAVLVVVMHAGSSVW